MKIDYLTPKGIVTNQIGEIFGDNYSIAIIVITAILVVLGFIVFHRRRHKTWEERNKH